MLDSLFANCDKETEAVIHNLYQYDAKNTRIIMSRCQNKAVERIAGCLQ